MSNPTLTSSPELSDSAQRASAGFVPTNQRVLASNMPLSVMSDVPSFPGTTPVETVTGTWVMAGTRVTANGVGVINTASVGVGYTAIPISSGPLQINLGNQNVLIKF